MVKMIALISTLIPLTLLILGVYEKDRNKKNVNKLKIRVNVNGVRGKSTATRLITSILQEAGYTTVGKTTGSAARYITPSGLERELERKPEGPNIKEQMKTIKYAAEDGADALVCECMAVRPEYQDIYQNQMFMANVTVIVNVLEDHMDVMGPTLDEVARAFSRTIPYNGQLITIKNKYADFFTRVAKERNTEITFADTKEIPEGYLNKFNYILFPENIALGLAVAKALKISKKIALDGMLKAAPDPGALCVNYLDEVNWNGSVFVNGFAANEPRSSLKIWELVQKMTDLPLKNSIIIFNGRPDRVDRTQQFVEDFFPHLKGVTLVGMGQGIKSIQENMNKGCFPDVLEYVHLENAPPHEVINTLRGMMKNRLLFGVGNIHGDAQDLIEALLHKRTKNKAVPTSVAPFNSTGYCVLQEKIAVNY
ncbi:MAG: poly-gamma-glutamate synthase PgsB [Nitrososphaerota archaeon]|jgi:poly-gamma-glutamate synthase PgsB/CapB|nr:poly-gamma-glutamate synthase PgsB [Nitrososphaerota archaeon]